MRPNGEVYVVEGADVVPLPEDPMAVEADAAKCDRLQASTPALPMRTYYMPASGQNYWVVWICRLGGQTCGKVLSGACQAADPCSGCLGSEVQGLRTDTPSTCESWSPCLMLSC